MRGPHVPVVGARPAPRAALLAAVAAALIVIGAGCGAGASARSQHKRPADRHAGLRPHSLTLGFSGDPVLTGGPPTDAVWIPRAVAEGAQIVRVNVAWSAVAPAAPPPGFNPANPASPGYTWSSTDTAVRDLSAHGLKILIDVMYAPTWAEGPGRPTYEPPGTWRPDAKQLAAFATAIARRYDGHYPDPDSPGHYLPRVRFWQPWNEPNLDEYLSPQWTPGPKGWVDTSPVIYRRLLNAFYAAVKRVSPTNFVVTAGTAPYGDWPKYDRPGHERMQPLRFYRDLFCLRGATALRRTPCPDPAHFDAIDHHVYGVYGPLWHAANADDIATPDNYKLVRVLQAAQRAGTVLPRGPKQQWVTEISWSSKPPNIFGVPLHKHARWYEQALYELWRQGVDTVLFLLMRDSVPHRFNPGPQGGLYFLDGRPKPAATAFRFPFVTERLNPEHVQVWGRSPRAGTLRVERRNGRHWTVIQSLRVRTHQVFLRSIALRGAGTLRAQAGAQTSLPWRQGA